MGTGISIGAVAVEIDQRKIIIGAAPELGWGCWVLDLHELPSGAQVKSVWGVFFFLITSASANIEGKLY